MKKILIIIISVSLFFGFSCASGTNKQKSILNKIESLKKVQSGVDRIQIVEDIANSIKNHKQDKELSKIIVESCSLLKDENDAVIYWAAMALSQLGKKAEYALPYLYKALKDVDPYVSKSSASGIELAIYRIKGEDDYEVIEDCTLNIIETHYKGVLNVSGERSGFVTQLFSAGDCGTKYSVKGYLSRKSVFYVPFSSYDLRIKMFRDGKVVWKRYPKIMGVLDDNRYTVVNVSGKDSINILFSVPMASNMLYDKIISYMLVVPVEDANNNRRALYSNEINVQDILQSNKEYLKRYNKMRDRPHL